MTQKMWRYNVFKCPKRAGCCTLVGSYESEDEAIVCEEEENKIVEDNFIILVHKLEYDV